MLADNTKPCNLRIKKFQTCCRHCLSLELVKLLRAGMSETSQIQNTKCEVSFKAGTYIVFPGIKADDSVIESH